MTKYVPPLVVHLATSSSPSLRGPNLSTNLRPFPSLITGGFGGTAKQMTLLIWSAFNYTMGIFVLMWPYDNAVVIYEGYLGIVKIFAAPFRTFINHAIISQGSKFWSAVTFMKIGFEGLVLLYSYCVYFFCTRGDLKTFDPTFSLVLPCP